MGWATASRTEETHQSLGNKVALLFFLITAAAFGVIYFWVVTQPESSLEERRLQDLELVADASTRSLERLQVGDSGQRDLDKACARWPNPPTRG